LSEIAVHDPRPQLLNPGVVKVCQASIIIAAFLSIELNVYHNVEIGHLPGLLGWTVGISVPVLVAFLSHVAAKVRLHWAVKAWVFAIVALLMYVSASSGLAVLAPGLHTGPALATAVGADLAAMTLLGFLMYAAEKQHALTEWQGREDARARQAHRSDLDSKFGRGGRGGTGGGTGPGNGQGNGAAGNGQGDTAVPDPGPQDPTGNGDGTNVVTPLRGITDDEMRELARGLADDLALVGKRLTVAAYREKYRGKNARVAKIVREVNDERARAGQQPAAAAGVR